MCDISNLRGQIKDFHEKISTMDSSSVVDLIVVV